MLKLYQSSPLPVPARAAMFGLDPFYFTSVEDQKLAKPGMYWGFTNTTCSVDLDKSARCVPVTHCLHGGRCGSIIHHQIPRASSDSPCTAAVRRGASMTTIMIRDTPSAREHHCRCCLPHYLRSVRPNVPINEAIVEHYQAHLHDDGSSEGAPTWRLLASCAGTSTAPRRPPATACSTRSTASAPAPASGQAASHHASQPN